MQLRPGANAPVPTEALTVTLSWPAGSRVDLDLCALLLGADGRVRDDRDMVFYNQPVHPGGAVRHLGRDHAQPDQGQPIVQERLVVDVPRLEPAVQRVVLVAAGDGGPVASAGPTLTVQSYGGPVAQVRPVLARETAALLVEIYRREGGWRVRAVGQGWDSGLAGLATDFGISVDEPRSAAQAPVMPPPSAGTPIPPPVTRPAAAPRPELSKGEEKLPLEMRKRLSLRKEQIAVSLRKHGAGDGLRARVVLVLDASGSMSKMYTTGVVGAVVERMAAVAAVLDDDATMQAWTFATNCARLPDLHLGELPTWIGLHVRVGESQPNARPRLLLPGQLDMRTIGGRNEEHKVIDEVRRFVAAEPVPVPTLVLFFSDGEVKRNEEIATTLREAAVQPIFWQFVGLGRAKFGILERFDTMSGRIVDNVGFFAVEDIAAVTDTDLYDRLLGEFPSYVTAARRVGVLC